jgi:hypothetical protein
VRNVAGIRPPSSNGGSGRGSKQLSGGFPPARRYPLDPNLLGDSTSIGALAWAFVRSTRPGSGNTPDERKLRSW